MRFIFSYSTYSTSALLAFSLSLTGLILLNVLNVCFLLVCRRQSGRKIFHQRFTHSMHVLGAGRRMMLVGGGGGGVGGGGGFSASVTWHCECQTPITLIRAGICMIKRIRDFNQKNPLVWKCDTLWQARLSPPQPPPHPALQQPHRRVVVAHEYA